MDNFALLLKGVAQAVSNLFSKTVTLVETLVGKYLGRGKQYKAAFAKACEQHREDMLEEKRGIIFKTSHTTKDVEETAQQLLSGWCGAAWRDFHGALATLIDSCTTGLGFLSDVLERIIGSQKPTETLWEQYLWSLDHCDSLFQLICSNRL